MWPAAGLCTCYRVQTRCGCGLLPACVPVIEYRRVVDVACCWLVYLLQSTDALWMWPAVGLCTCYRVQTRCGCGLLLACVPESAEQMLFRQEHFHYLLIRRRQALQHHSDSITMSSLYEIEINLIFSNMSKKYFTTTIHNCL